jgi:hypothetical protein
MGKLDVPLKTRIGRILAAPNVYHNFPAPVVYKSRWGYNRAKCPIEGCKYDGFVVGFNQHYARMHAPDQWRQKAHHIIKAVRATQLD